MDGDWRSKIWNLLKFNFRQVIHRLCTKKASNGLPCHILTYSRVLNKRTGRLLENEKNDNNTFLLTNKLKNPTFISYILFTLYTSIRKSRLGT